MMCGWLWRKLGLDVLHRTVEVVLLHRQVLLLLQQHLLLQLLPLLQRLDTGVRYDRWRLPRALHRLLLML
jgi:hypothetical protein